MMSAGIRSGVNWMRWKLQVQRAGERAHEQRLAEARHAFEQHVAAGDMAMSACSTISSWPTMTLRTSVLSCWKRARNWSSCASSEGLLWAVMGVRG